jgi:hypothetical protein
MRLSEMTVPGQWKKIGDGEWEMDGGKGWTVSVSKKGKKYRWEVTGRRHSSHGTENSFKDAQTIGIKQYRQVRQMKEERGTEMYRNPIQQGSEPDTKEEFQTMGSAKLDDYGLIAKINRRNKMRALNLINGRGFSAGKMGESIQLPEGGGALRERKHDMSLVLEARETPFVKKVKAMSDNERKKLTVDARSKFMQEQMRSEIMSIADQVSRTINAKAPKMNVVRVNMQTGKIEKDLYTAQGLLERVIAELEERV